MLLPDDGAGLLATRTPNAKWRAKGLVAVFLGNRCVWSAQAGARPLAPTGGPKLVAGKFGPAVGFGSTYGGGTTDRLDGGILPRPSSGWRSIVSHYYANGTGGGGFGRVFMENSSTPTEMVYVNSSRMTYYMYANASVGQWDAPISSLATGRWQSFGVTHDQRTMGNVPTEYLDGTSVSVVVQSNSSGVYNSAAFSPVFGNRPSDSARCWDGLIGPVLFFDGALTDADHAALDRNPLQVFDPDDLAIWLPFSAASGDALTNNLVTTASGILAPSSSLALTNNLVTSATGVLTPVITKPLTNNLVTSATGTLTPVISQSLTNNLATTATGSLGAGSALVNNLVTSATGTLTPVISNALSNNLATTAAGSLGTTAALTNNLATSAAGTLTSALTTALTDNAATTANGAIAATLSITLANNLATSASGSLTAAGNYNAALANNLATSAAGALTPVVTTSVMNNLATSASGALSPRVSLAIDGNALASDVGVIAANVSLTLANNLATSAVGDLSVFYGATLTNNLVTTSTGLLTPKISKALSGVAVTASEGAVGVTGYNEVVALSGYAANAQAGLLSVFAPNEIVTLNSPLALSVGMESFLAPSVNLQSRIFS